METEPQNHGGTTPRVLLANATVGATLGALLLSLGEGVSVVWAGGGVRGCIAVGAAGFVLALLSAAASALVITLLRAGLALLERRGADWCSLLGAMLGSAFCVLGAQALVLKVLHGQGIRTATVALAAPVGVMVGVALATVVRAQLAQRSPASLTTQVAIVLASSIAMACAVIGLAPGFVEELEVPQLLALSWPLACALPFALYAAPLRHASRFSVIALAVLGASLPLHLVLPVTPRLGFATQQSTLAANAVLSLLQRDGAEAPRLAESGTCHPGVAYGPLRGNKRVASAAPDVVVVTIDAVRWDHMSLSGYARDTTAKLRPWAESAAVFTRAYSPASSTRQTFRALFTGLYPSQVPPAPEVSWWGVGLPKEQRTLAMILREAGYRSSLIAADSGAFAPEFGGTKGFELPDRHLKPPPGGRAGRMTQQLDLVLATLREPRRAPRLVWTHLAGAHQPYTVDMPSPYGEREIDRYDNAIRFVDGELARLLQALKDEGRLEHTYVFVSSDHGQAFGEHGSNTHGHTTYAEETHVPLLVWGPGVAPGKRSAPVSTLDLFPTLLDVATLGTLEAACGASLVPMLRDAKLLPRRDVYMEQVPDKKPYFGFSFVRGSHKLVGAPRSAALSLFDIEADPGDQHDLSASQPERFAQLRVALIEHQLARGLNPRSYQLLH